MLLKAITEITLEMKQKKYLILQHLNLDVQLKKFDLFNFKRECKRFSSIQELRNLSKKDFASLKLKYTNKDLMEKFGQSLMC